MLDIKRASPKMGIVLCQTGRRVTKSQEKLQDGGPLGVAQVVNLGGAKCLTPQQMGWVLYTQVGFGLIGMQSFNAPVLFAKY